MTPPWADKDHEVLFEDDQTVEVCVKNGDCVYFQTWRKLGRQYAPTANYGATIQDMRKVFGLLKK